MPLPRCEMAHILVPIRNMQQLVRSKNNATVCYKYLNWSLTVLLFPPSRDRPTSQRCHLPKLQQTRALVSWICWTFLSLSLTLALLSPQSGFPHVTTLPSAKIAAKAKPAAWICWTFLSLSVTLALLPPQQGSPHVTTLPSAKIAANARSVVWICWMFLSWSWTIALLPPWCSSPMWQSCYLQHTTMPMRPLLQFLWASLPQQYCCLHFEARKLEEVPLDPKGGRQGQQALGKHASKTAAQPFSDQERCHLFSGSDRAAHRPLGNTTFSCRVLSGSPTSLVHPYICAFCCQAACPKSNSVNNGEADWWLCAAWKTFHFEGSKWNFNFAWLRLRRIENRRSWTAIQLGGILSRRNTNDKLVPILIRKIM